ncbi:MAG: LysM peptidoglycan-binding domain-containing protein [Phycisphaerales bacterium]|nr:MAG: LysM peptidoglycan-binding domain-containing protein [Phycisphaerales bacterium]
MTSDAKIGLLLGLIFIFVIAFIINGLPRFRGVTNNSELTTTMVSAPNGTIGIGGNERRVQDDFDWPPQANEQPPTTAQMPLEEKEDVRFTMKLPQEISFITDPLTTEPSNVQVARDVEPAATPPAEPAVPAPQPQTIAEARKPEPVRPAAPKEYVVCDGDTLADIAKKFYGPEEGNKRANIKRIFEANRQILESVDDIDVGQKLAIPRLGVSGPDTEQSGDALPGSIFQKAIAIGKKHLLPESSKVKPAAEYVVREGDNLWRIAARQLGNGNRYPEIARLNADTLKDEDNLEVGLRLKIPAR